MSSSRQDSSKRIRASPLRDRIIATSTGYRLAVLFHQVRNLILYPTARHRPYQAAGLAVALALALGLVWTCSMQLNERQGISLNLQVWPSRSNPSSGLALPASPSHCSRKSPSQLPQH